MNDKGKNPKKIMKRLSVLWMTSFALLGIAETVRKVNAAMVTSVYRGPAILSGFQLFILFSVIFYFLPLLLAIHHYARLANSKRVIILVSVIMLVLSVWLVLALIETISAAIRIW